MTEKITKKARWELGIFLALAILMWVSVIIFGSSSYADEGDHLRQIHRFMKGNYAVMSQLTTIPGYHVVIATVASVFGNPIVKQIRLISLAFSLISVGVFYLIAKKLNAKNPHIRTLQYIFLPISFFYFPLIYTDIFSLLLILTAFYFALSKRYSMSAFFSLASLLVRQNNIIWIAFFWVYTYVSENGFSFSLEKIMTHLRRGVGYIMVSILFVIFALVNHGISIGDKEQQQVGFYMGNIYFFLAVVGFLFLPVLIMSIAKIRHTVSKKQVIFGLLAGAITASLFVFFPPEVHQYNMKLKFLRNIILSLAYHQYIWAYALAIFLGCQALIFMKFDKKSLLLFPFVGAYLVPSLLVEQRYLIVPVVFLLFFRKEINPKAEFASVFYFLALSAGLMYMLLKIEIFF